MLELPFIRQRVAIVGLGLMGGSLALALRGRCATILALEPNPQSIALARQNLIVDQVSDDPREILPQADIIVLAAPVRSILEMIPRLPEWTTGTALVVDLGSTKMEICTALASLPTRFEAVGGHPMCGKEFSSLAYADANLYQMAPFALCALPATSSEARRLAETLAREVGAHPLWLDALTHDRWVAATSHLPYVLANALAAATPAEAAPLVGPGLRSSTRVAGSSLKVMNDILLTNRSEVLAALAGLQQRLDSIRTVLESGDEQSLLTALAAGETAYRQVVLAGGR